MLLLFITFIAGVLTVFAPCILPLLPIIVGGSLSDGTINKKKALTVVAALGVSVVVFTLLLKFSTLLIAIPEYTWTLISGGIVVLLGIVTLFPSLWENQLIAQLSAQSNILLGKGDQKKSFWGDVIVGSALGPIFSSCSPTYFIVIATVLPARPAVGLLYLLSYTVGLCLSLLAVTFVGQKILQRLNVASDPKSTLKRVLGILFILVGLAILAGYDKKIESALIGSGFFDVTKLEQKLLENTAPEGGATIGAKGDASQYLTLAQKDMLYKKAPELSSIDGYINTDGAPITLASLKGKVVLLDIWTYSCINCQRTLPYIIDWYAKYKDSGLVVVGLHTPEFGFEKVQANVERAVQGFHITYPVVLDNDYSTWKALGNQYWPRKYLIDSDGYIVYDHIGEGNYDETEKAIQRALKEREARLGMNDTVSQATSSPLHVVSFEPDRIKSPEVYFGSSRNDYFANGKRDLDGVQALTLPSHILSNALYLEGNWNFTSEYAENMDAATIVFNYDAKNVYMAAGSGVGATIEIFKDDVFVKKVTVTDETLYPLIEGTSYGAHTLRIKITKPGLRAFTFTFG